MNKIQKSLFIEGREWFDKVNGNSYFSARIWVDGEIVGVLPFQYGYGDQYTSEAQRWLVAEGYLPEDLKGWGLWSVADRAGFDYYATKATAKKRDMFKVTTAHKVGV
jgi:hypothetical protein